MSEHELWNEIGNLYFLSGTHIPAIQAYTKSIELNGAFGRPYSNLAMIHVQQGLYERSIGLYRRSIELLSDSMDKAITWNRLGDVYRQLKNYDMAVSAYQEADKLYPPDAHVGQDQPGRDKDVPLMISMPAFHLVATPSEETSLNGDASQVFIPSDPESAGLGIVISTKDEFSTPDPETLGNSTSAILDSLFHNEKLDTHENEKTSTESDSWSHPESENFLMQEDHWLPLMCEDLTNPVTEDEVSISQENLETPEMNPKNAMVPVRSRNSIWKELKLNTIIQPEQTTGNHKESDFRNTTPASDGETESHLKVENNLDTKLNALDSTPPVDEAQSVSETVDDARNQEPDLIPLPVEWNVEKETEIGELKKIVDRNPRNAMAWDALGSHFKNNGQYEEAIFAYEHAIAIAVKNASFYYHLGLVYAASKRNEDALRLFKKVIELDPDYSLAHATLSGYYRRMGLEELARQHIKKALNNTFKNENEYNRACLESICENADRALEFLELALQNQQSYRDWALHDPDLEFVRNDTRFMPLIAKYETKTQIEGEAHYCKVQMGCG